MAPMSASWSALVRLVLAAGAFVCGAAALASEDELPDAEFLEYLGSWEESDEDWLVVEQINAVRAEQDPVRTDSAAEAEESPEKDDES